MWPGVDILLCAFHVKQAWGLKLVQKVSSKEAQKAIGKGLDKLMRFNTAPEHGETLQHHANVQIKEFLAEFQEHTAFVEYFKAHWARRPGAHQLLCVVYTYANLIMLLLQARMSMCWVGHGSLGLE